MRRQVVLFAGAYILYEVVRGIADGNPAKAFWNATKIINFERLLHVFVEPSVQAWTAGRHWLMDFADWTYLNAHYVVTIAALVFLYQAAEFLKLFGIELLALDEAHEKTVH